MVICEGRSFEGINGIMISDKIYGVFGDGTKKRELYGSPLREDDVVLVTVDGNIGNMTCVHTPKISGRVNEVMCSDLTGISFINGSITCGDGEIHTFECPVSEYVVREFDSPDELKRFVKGKNAINLIINNDLRRFVDVSDVPVRTSVTGMVGRVESEEAIIMDGLICKFATAGSVMGTEE